LIQVVGAALVPAMALLAVAAEARAQLAAEDAPPFGWLAGHGATALRVVRPRVTPSKAGC
jgi:hypothetical protein